MSVTINIFSAIAFILLIICIALLLLGIERALCRSPKGNGSEIFAPFERFFCLKSLSRKDLRFCSLFSTLSAAVIYFFIPMEPLPPFLRIDGSLIITWALILGAGLFGDCANKRGSLFSRFTAVLLIFSGAYAYFSMNIGLPGDLLCFGTYAAAPFYAAADFWGRLGAFLFFLAFVMSAPDFKNLGREMPEVYLALASSIPSAVIAAIFLRFDFGTLLGLSGYGLFASGFLFFWIKVMAVRFIFIPALRALSARPAAAVSSLWLILSLCAAALFAVNVNL